MGNDRNNVVKRASYRLSFKTVRNTDGSYTVSAIRMDDKGNQSPIDKKDNTLNIFLGSIFGKAIEDTLTSFINDDDGRVNETVEAMFDIAGIGIDRPDKAHNHVQDRLWYHKVHKGRGHEDRVSTVVRQTPAEGSDIAGSALARGLHDWANGLVQ